MKTFITFPFPTTSLFLMCILFLINTSCQEPDSNEITKTEAITGDEKLAHDVLRNYASTILSLSSETGFRNNLYNAIEDYFDGESNVLFKTLMDERINPTYAKKLHSNLSRISSSALTALNNIEGNNYFPQVFIPFYDELKQQVN